MLRSALLDIQVTLLCVCEVDSFIPELEHLIENLCHGLFDFKEDFEIRFMDSSTSPPISNRLFLDFCEFFLQVAPNFLVSTENFIPGRS